MHDVFPSASSQGGYARGVRHGGGVMLYANGDRCEACWAAGFIEGTAEYSFASGAVELGRYRSGAEAGEGVAWSSGREQAWKTWDGVRREAVSLQEASEVAARLKGAQLRTEDDARAAMLLEAHAAAGPASPRKPSAISRHSSSLRGMERSIAPPSVPALSHLPLGPGAGPASRPARRDVALPSCCNGSLVASEPASAPSQSSRHPGTPTGLGDSLGESSMGRAPAETSLHPPTPRDLGDSSLGRAHAETSRHPPTPTDLGDSSLGDSSMDRAPSQSSRHPGTPTGLGDSSMVRDAWWDKRTSARASPMPQRAFAPLPQFSALHAPPCSRLSPGRMCFAQQPAWAAQQLGAGAPSPVEGRSPMPPRPPPKDWHTPSSYLQASPVMTSAQPLAPYSSPLVPPMVLPEPRSRAVGPFARISGLGVEVPCSDAAEEEAIIQRLYDEERLAMRRSMSREPTPPDLL